MTGFATTRSGSLVIAHIVPDTSSIDTHGDAATYCGDVVTGYFDFQPLGTFDCAVCVHAEARA